MRILYEDAVEQNTVIYEDEVTGIRYVYIPGSDGNYRLVPLNVADPHQFNKADREELEKQDKEREEQIKKELEDYDPEKDGAIIELEDISNLIDDKNFIDKLLDETEHQVRISKKIRKAEAERAQQNTQAYNFDGNMGQFTEDLTHLIASEVKEFVKKDWGKFNKRAEGSGILKPGKTKKKNPHIPRLFVYYDQSGSWDEDDIKRGDLAMAALASFEKKKQLIIETYYFANTIQTSAAVARNEGGTHAGQRLIEHIASHKPDNVVIMTDEDFDRFGEIRNAGSVTVPGGVFLLFRRGSVSRELVARVHGRRKTKIYSI